MSIKSRNPVIKMIPVDRIHILNPRVRNQKIFRNISENITTVGLKRPITATRSKSKIPEKDLDLVCGQGRLEAFIAHGQKEIPAILIDATEEEALIMSLVENLARNLHRPLDLLRGIEALKQKGYGRKIIAQKTGLKESYVRVVLRLLAKGEDRLLAAVEAGHIPVSVAASIANSPHDEQRILQEAYENHELRGHKLKRVKRLLDKRKQLGKSLKRSTGSSAESQQKKPTSYDVIRIYQKEVDRKRLLTRKANVTNRHMTFITEALRRLFAESDFYLILKSEGLTSVPKPISMLLDAES